jgi:hypothetical protein
MAIAERVTVLRDGRNLGTYWVRDLDRRRLGELITGHVFESSLKPRFSGPDRYHAGRADRAGRDLLWRADPFALPFGRDASGHGLPDARAWDSGAGDDDPADERRPEPGDHRDRQPFGVGPFRPLRRPGGVLGGVDPTGGFGKVLGLFLSLILLQIIATAFNLLGFSEFLTQFPKGSDVAIIEGDPGTTSSMKRVTGFTNAAKEGGLNIVASQPANWNRRLPHERDSLLTSGRCRPNLTFPHSQRHMCQYSSLTFVPRGTIISHRPNFLPNTIC